MYGPNIVPLHDILAALGREGVAQTNTNNQTPAQLLSQAEAIVGDDQLWRAAPDVIDGTPKAQLRELMRSICEDE